MRWFVYLLVASISSVASAQGALRPDGNWWKSESALRRTVFVAGYVSAQQDDVVMISGHLCAMEGKTGNELTACSSERQRRLMKEAYIGFDGGSVGQVVDGLDAFYADFRNRHVKFTDAARIVAMAIGGAPEATIQSVTEASRRSAP